MNEAVIDVVAGAEGVLLSFLSAHTRGTALQVALTCAMANRGISKQISESTSARDMCSASVYGPTDPVSPMTPAEIGQNKTLAFLDRMDRNEKRDAHALPEREEQDTLDT